MNRTPDKTGLSVASQRLDNITPNILVKSLWVSTALALIFVVPLGIILAGCSKYWQYFDRLAHWFWSSLHPSFGIREDVIISDIFI